MSSTVTPSTAPSQLLRFWLPCLGVALLVRLYFFSGLSMRDDVNYWLQSIATGQDNSWPPLPTHWHLRIGFVLPCALLIKIFGLKLWVPYVFTMLGGLLEIVLVYFLTREFVSERAAQLAAWLCVFFPLNILYSTYLYVDLWSGVLGALSLFYWQRGLKQERTADYAWASFYFGVAWLFRETVVLMAPVYLGLWLQAGRWWRPKLVWAVPPALLLLAAEIWVYYVTTGNWHMRLDAMQTAQVDPTELEILNASCFGGGYWTDPLCEIFISHHLGLFFVAGFGFGLWHWRRCPRELLIWLVVGFGWLSWGPTGAHGWSPLQRDPRYLSVLTFPCLALTAAGLLQLRSAVWRQVFVGILIVAGLFGAAVDLGRGKLSAYRKFGRAEKYNSPATVLEPFVYFGVRAAQDFVPARAHFSCATDLGRGSTVTGIVHLTGTQLAASSTAHYVVLSVQTHPEKWKTKMNLGWRKVEEFPGEGIWARDLTTRAVSKIIGRKMDITPPSGLIVLENPAWTPVSGQ